MSETKSASPDVYATTSRDDVNEQSPCQERFFGPRPPCSCGAPHGPEPEQVEQHDQGAAAELLVRGVPRARLPQVDEDGDPSAPTRAAQCQGGGPAPWHDLDDHTGGHPRCSQGSQEEGRLGEVVRGDLPHDGEPKRHGGDPRGPGAQDHLRQQGTGGRGCHRVWEAQQPPVLRHAGPRVRELRELGHDHSAGESHVRVRSKVVSSGTLAGDTEPGGPDGEDPWQSSTSHAKEDDQGLHDHTRNEKVPRDGQQQLGAHGGPGPKDRGPDRGPRGDQVGAEGDQRREGPETGQPSWHGLRDGRGQPVGCLLLSDQHPAAESHITEGVNANVAGVAKDEWPGNSLSASQLLSQQLSIRRPKVEQLSEQQARSLEAKAASVVPSLFQDLVGYNRPVLLQYSERPDTVLMQAVQERAKSSDAAVHSGPWNGCDMLTKEGLRLLLERIRMEQPQHVWLAPPVGARSPLTNMHQRTEAQRDELQAKRHEALRRYVACACVVHLCVQQGIHVSWEMPEQSQAWRLPLLNQLRSKYDLYTAVTKGCAVNCRDQAKGALVRQGWRIITTHKQLSEGLNLGCSCPRNYQHGTCVGGPKQPELPYTKEYAQSVKKT